MSVYICISPKKKDNIIMIQEKRMTNKIFHKHSMHHVFLLISSLLVLEWLHATTSTSLPPQTIDGAGNYECIDIERRVLLHFKSNIDQDPHGLLSTWIPQDEATNDCCKWSGVTCNNQTGHVTAVDLRGGDLQGKISPSFLLTSLNHLDLSFNSFHGTIPMSIGSLTELRYLDLSYNSFHGTIPQELGNLTNLLRLSLDSLQECTTENLDWLSHLSLLEDLDMSGISLGKVDKWVNIILSLQKLSVLSLSGCELSQVMHPYSYSYANSSSSSIITLDLRYNNLNSSMYHWLFPLTSNKLEHLYLDDNKLDTIPKYFGNLCSLTSLYLDFNYIDVKFSDFLNNLSGCASTTLQHLIAQVNQLTGSLSDEIQMFSSLVHLFLSGNKLNGNVSEKVWKLPKLITLDVSFNSLNITTLFENIGKTKILAIYISNNSLEGAPSEVNMLNLSSVQELDLSSCKLGPHFPKWIQTLKNLTHIDISNTRISDTIPEGFWNKWPSRLTYLNLSLNNFTEKVTMLSSISSPKPLILDLSANNFYGHIPNVPSNLRRLDLSRNKLYGDISFLCQIVDGFLEFLDLSHNLFTGRIPNCLQHFKNLIVLSLGHNKLSGALPSSIEYLISLKVINLYNNNLSGELPLSLKNCTNLTFLGLGANKFSGYVPAWIGERLLALYALILTSNNFYGIIPLQLCQLVNLQILDLSINNINGTIPQCIGNLTAMVVDGSSPYPNVHFLSLGVWNEYVDHATIKWQGSVREFGSILGLVKVINLSSNNLTGKIPYELTDLHKLIALDLSMNTLLGVIPPKIGEMKELQSLDISRNYLTGEIPSSMSHMTFLNHLNVSYNNLSGRVPSSTQLQSFEPSSYIGNAELCGLPVSKYCHGDKELDVPPITGESENDGEGIDDPQRWFYIGGATGFGTGFWIMCITLLVNYRARHAFFQFLDSLVNWVYVKVMVFIAKMRRVAHP